MAPRTTLTWSERFGVHDMGDWAIYVPPVGLVEPDTRTPDVRRVLDAVGTGGGS